MNSLTPEILEIDDYGEAHLPILLRVADYSVALQQNGNLRLRDFLAHACGEANLSTSEKQTLFEEALSQGRALVIFDGLDEVAQTADRATIARRIDDFVNGIDPQNRIVVTSRIAGYPAARLDARFLPVTMRDMEFEQIARFVTYRIAAYERAQTPGATQREIYQRAQPEIEAILSAVQNNAGVKRLAVNPLLLTILCLIHRTGARLPERRVKLYEEVSETLLVHWRPANTGRGDKETTVPMAEADRLLAPLAEWMHEHTSRGMLPKEKAQEMLRRFSAERRGVQENDPTVEQEIANFWHRLTYETSVFVERNTGEYAFLHLTFEEYWAARYLIRDFKQAAVLLRERRHNPRFREVIRLAIASRTEEDAASLIRSAIWCPASEAQKWGYKPAEYEEELHRDLFLAADCLSDCAAIETRLAKAVASALVALYLHQDSAPYIYSLEQRVFATFSALQRGDIGGEVRRLFMVALKDEDRIVRSGAAQALGSVGQGHPEVVQALIAALKDEDSDVRSAAWEALWNLIAASSGSSPA